MGEQHRAEPSSNVENNLREIRSRKGLSQTDLAARSGITRQAVCAIEANQYLPTTAVALRLAGVLNCKVEDLFRLISTGEIVQGESVTGVHAESLSHNARVKVVRVGERLIVRTVASLGDVLNYAIAADGLVVDLPGGSHKRVEPRP